MQLKYTLTYYNSFLINNKAIPYKYNLKTINNIQYYDFSPDRLPDGGYKGKRKFGLFFTIDHVHSISNGINIFLGLCN